MILGNLAATSGEVRVQNRRFTASKYSKLDGFWQFPIGL
jgi:hypothetical protein